MSDAFQRRKLVFDTTCLSHFARSDRLDVLADLLANTTSIIPDIVRHEIQHGAGIHPELAAILDTPWLEHVRLDTTDRLQRFASGPSTEDPGVFAKRRAGTAR